MLLCVCAPACAGDSPADGPPPVAVAASAHALSVADCPAGYNVIQGTYLADTLKGTAANDCILGGNGNDVIDGADGNDFLIGGPGNDRLTGGLGDDRIYGEGETDTIFAGAGNDFADGGLGNDSIDGADGNDRLLGDAGAETITGGPGADFIDGGDGADFLYGYAGDDTIRGGLVVDYIYGGAGNDVIDGGAALDRLYGESGQDFILRGGTTGDVVNGGSDADACTGTSCEGPEPVPTGCTSDAACSATKRCVVEIGLCVGCTADADGDGRCDNEDGCPYDSQKTASGVCGCSVPDTDSDGDGTADCRDGCASDPAKIAPGQCGCSVVDTDADADGTADCTDGCPEDPAKVAPGACDCGTSDADSDGDGTANCVDGCAGDPGKVDPGACGCGLSEADDNGDGEPDCSDDCPDDPAKTAPGACGCGVSDLDGDADGSPDCSDVCPGFDDDMDSNGNGIPDGCDGPPGVTCMATGSIASSAADIGLGDLDRDGDADAFVIGYWQDAVWLNAGNGRFGTRNLVSVPDSNLGSVEIADLDRDGKLDAVSTVVRGSVGPRGRIFYGNGAGALSMYEEFSAAAGGMVIADVTGDQTLDTAFIETNLRVMRGATPPALGQAGMFAYLSLSGWLGRSLAAGNFDGDGAAELLAAGSFGVRYYDFASDGTLSAERSISTSEAIAAIADFDANGVLDAVVADYALRVKLGTALGAPQFNDAASMSLSFATLVDLEIADMNGDGRPDILLLTGSELRIVAFSGRLIELQRYAIAGANAVSAADLDGDGDIDIALATGGGASPVLLCHP